MRLVPGHLEAAISADAAAIAALRTSVADRLTAEFGPGHWSAAVSERSVLQAIKSSRVLVMRERDDVVATLCLATKKPWAIDTKYFTMCKRPLYLTDMAVAPNVQRRGIGRRCLEQARAIVQAWPGDAIRLDAYDAAAGAGEFYAKCGFREVGRATYRHNALIYFEMLISPERVTR